MFKKVLLAEDFQGENHGMAQTLSEKLGIPELQEELYCDKALSRIKLALQQHSPYELLITDLRFEADHTERKLTSGKELINAVRVIQPHLNIIVYSVEDNPIKIDTLFKEQKINAYVCKGRNGLTELLRAVHEVYHHRTYFSPKINLNVANNVFELDDFDREILKELANGLTKKEISKKFKKANISPNSESTIDKRVSKLYDAYGAKNTANLLFKLAKEGRI